MQHIDHKQQSGTPDFEQAIRLFSAGESGAAAALCQRLLREQPGHGHALHLLGVIRSEEGSLEEGLGYLEQALASGLIHPALHYAHANVLMRLGRQLEAVDACRRSLELDPGQAHAIRLLCVALLQSGRTGEADALLQEAVRTSAPEPQFLDAQAMVRMAQGRYPEAQALLERCLELAPGFRDAYGNLAIVYEQENRLEEVSDLIATGLARWPDDATLKFVQARCERRDGDYRGAAAHLEALAANRTPSLSLAKDIEFELGWCADGVGDVDSAMRHFVEANRLAEQAATIAPGVAEGYPRQLEVLQALFGSLPAVTEDRPAGEEAEPSPVFLLGFPRSGTTLLDTMLSAHPDLSVLEEQPTIQAMIDALQPRGRRYPEDVLDLAPGELRQLRATYLAACRTAGWDGERLIVDKSPFATAHVGLLDRVFPGARFLFAARHPYDVCLSCFMNSFQLNSGTVHFTRMESTVRLYQAVLTLWSQYLRVLPLRYLVVRYEDVVQDPNGSLAGVLQFLGKDWSDAVLDHPREAVRRGRIPTPSYSQVSRPLYRSAIARWRRYEPYLRPHVSGLEPFARAFGYET